MEITSNWNGWEVKKIIGEGSFGKVYIIAREEFGHTYESALKVIRIPHNRSEVEVIRNEGLDDESVTSYFKSMVEDIVDEFALMSKLKGNTNIVSYEDHCVVPIEDGFGWEIYIRMELLTPLYDYMKNNTMSIRDIIQLGIDMCQALEVCQKYNIIHRDIKPENIFVSDLGKYKLGDFGIARQLEKTSSGLSKKGTYSYMAPEVYKGMAYNSTVDIYSLGIVLYRFLNNNRLPFLPPYPEAIMFSDKEKANVLRFSGEPMPNPCNAEGRLAEIVLKACAYDPKDRYESAVEMKKALQSVLYNEQEREVIYPEGDKLDNNNFSVSVDEKTDYEQTEFAPDSENDETVIMDVDVYSVEDIQTEETVADESVYAVTGDENKECRNDEVESEIDTTTPKQKKAPVDSHKNRKTSSIKFPKWIIFVAVTVVLVLIALLVTFFAAGKIKDIASCEHEWNNATCDTPKVCSLCGEEEGKPLGHKWTEATCTVAKTCSVCKKTEGNSLGHNWQPATRTTPEKCSLCAEEEGFFITMTDSVTSTQVTKLEGWDVTTEILNEPLKGCVKIKLNFSAWKPDNSPVQGQFRFYAKTLSGQWVYVTDFYAQGYTDVYELILGYDNPISFSEYVILPPKAFNETYTDKCYIEEAYLDFDEMYEY